MLVLYHKNCIDGWVAALQAYRKYGAHPTYLPIQYGDPAPSERGELVYILDFSIFPQPANSFMVDHHKTVFQKLGLTEGRYWTDRYLLDNDHSGAWLAHEFFRTPPHWLIDYAQDHDLWRFQLPDSRVIRHGLHLLPRRSIIEDAPLWLSISKEEVLMSGEIVERYVNGQVAGLVANAVPLRIVVDGVSYDCKAVNSGQWVSDVGHSLATQAVMWFAVGKDIVVSLRGPHSRLIAEAFGGGGHDEAAGFRLPGHRVVEILNGELIASN